MKSAGPFLAAALFVAFSAPAFAVAAKGTVPPSAYKATPLKNPMVFFRAKGAPNACGPGCDEWIAAEGELSIGTAERMRAFLKRDGGKRPIYFNSPGGITSESIAMGRLMRERGMTARVGRTVPDVCGFESRECAAAKRSGRELPSRLTNFAQCNSACVYAIAGARVREIAPDVRLGIHASRTVLYGYLPKNVQVPAEALARFTAMNQGQLRRYLADMGIQTSLLDAAEKIPHDSVRMLKREELVRFKIDTRRVVESDWVYDEQFSGSSNVFKSIDMTEAGGAGSRQTTLRLTCLGQDKFIVDYFRELGPKEDAFPPLKLVAAHEEFTLIPPAESLMSSDATKRYDARRTAVPVQVFQSAAVEDRIELADAVGDGKPGVTRLSTVGLASALSSLTLRCGPAFVPRQTP
jgi:hypothetical protein